MGTNIATAATSPALIPAAVQAAGGKEYTDEEVRGLVAALEEPFDPQEIKWRVTNTTKDRRRGQVVAYTDQRAYTDRLNAIFTVRGWTRKYAVEMINNVERKTSHERQAGFAEYDHVIQALPANRADHPLDVGSLPGRPRSRAPV